MKRISELQKGDSILGWLKIGFALRKQRRVDGTIYRDVPSRPDRFDKDDLQQFIGIVLANDTVSHILTVDVARATPMKRAVEPPLPADIFYLVFKRIRLISKYPHVPRVQNVTWPTQQAIGTAFQAYRTQEEIDLTW